MEAHLAPNSPAQVNKIASSCEICSGPYGTQYCMKNPEQAFVHYASFRTDDAGGKWFTFKPEQNNLGDTYNPSWKSHPNLRCSKFFHEKINRIFVDVSLCVDIYADGSENRPHMLNKDNYVPWSSRLLCYAKSKPNEKLIYNSNIHGLYVIRMIAEPGDPDCEVLVAETFYEQTDDELTDKEVKQMEADDQAIRTILMGLLEDIYAAIDSCETAQEIWLRVQQMMKGYDIGVQEKKAKLFNEWEVLLLLMGNRLRIPNQNATQNGNGNVVAAQAEGNGNGNNRSQ
nr:ribonuclease H-like domain-containing protein [Tanacetum cinerariifolium]